MTSDDFLLIQKNYAKRLNRFCIGNLAQQTLSDGSENQVNICGQKVLLRSTFDNMISGLDLIKTHGAIPIETAKNVTQIENWFESNLTNRKFWEIGLSAITQNILNDDFRNWLLENDIVFLKSKKKGVSAVIRSSRILEQDVQIIKFLEKNCSKRGEQLLITEYQAIKTDSIGTRESRHVIMDGHIINSSRLVQSIKHTVPKSHMVKARETVDTICSSEDFPKNYVLDIGDFIDGNGKAGVDIVEINPLSCSMCYVNNSVFETAVPEISEIQEHLGFGMEYCYDAISHPEHYSVIRAANKSYTYAYVDRYVFL